MHHSGARSTRRRPWRKRGATLPPLLAPAPAPVEEKKAPDADTTFKEATRKLKKLLEVEKGIWPRSRKHMRSGRESFEDAFGARLARRRRRGGGKCRDEIGRKARTSNAPGAPLDSAGEAAVDDRARAIGGRCRPTASSTRIPRRSAGRRRRSIVGFAENLPHRSFCSPYEP